MKAAEPADIEEWYLRYGPMVLRRCRWILRDEHQAKDVMQDCFVQLLREKRRLQVTTPSGLLLQIATRLCLNRLRTRKRHPEDADEALLHSIAVAGTQEDRSLAAFSLRRIFADGETTETMAVLHFLDGLTLEEVAEQTGYSVSGVRKRLKQLQTRVQGLSEVSHEAA